MLITLLFYAFVAGLVTILAPCIWPLLPIVLSSAATSKGHQRPLGITLGVILSFAVFTLSLSSLIKLFHFDPNNVRIIAVIVLGLFGLALIIPTFGTLTESLMSKLIGRLGIKSSGGKGFMGGFFTGLSLGVVWAPCAGPILATIAVLAAQGKVSADVIAVTIAYVLGIGIPLFIFAYGGQQLVTRTRFVSRYTGRIQQLFGVIMIITAIAIFTNYDKLIEAKLLNVFPSFSTSLTSIETNPVVAKQLDLLKNQHPVSQQQDTTGLFNTNTPAPEFTGITQWLNPKQPLTMISLKGKVVLIDFWTYTCINCLRTLPHVTQWYDTYHDKGFVVIGVHTPEFEFEKETNNVLQAIQQYGIHYPVAQDNNYATWNVYSNQYWPAEYLIDAQGMIRRTHFGEGEYDVTEKAIQALLNEAGKQVSVSIKQMPDDTPSNDISPETYLGSRRMQYLYPNGQTSNGTQNFTAVNTLSANTFSLGGQWNITDENAVTGKNASLVYNFTAKKVFLVLRPPNNAPARIQLFLDGKRIESTNAGTDVKDSTVTIDTDRLYNLVRLQHVENHILKIEFLTPDTQAFAFTFG